LRHQNHTIIMQAIADRTEAPVSTLQSETADYHFITTWNVKATREEVYRILEDVERLVDWWPSVYLDVNVREKGQPGGIGKLVSLHTKGWLPYTLRWDFQVVAAEFPKGFALRASGDFIGRGIWHFEQRGETCTVSYDWKISVAKPLLSRLTWLLRRLFSANHEWAMRKGLESLELELQRRRGVRHVPPPPGPTFPHNLTNKKIRVG
jgi:Polyketide cyclase / dehydrase and lipid transport